MPLVINALGGRHTHIKMCKPMQFQETRHASATGLCVLGLKNTIGLKPAKMTVTQDMYAHMQLVVYLGTWKQR